jgi:hypothetical protein
MRQFGLELEAHEFFEFTHGNPYCWHLAVLPNVGERRGYQPVHSQRWGDGGVIQTRCYSVRIDSGSCRSLILVKAQK